MLSENPTSGSAKDTDKEDFIEIFPILAQEILRELPTTYEMPPHAIEWMRKVGI